MAYIDLWKIPNYMLEALKDAKIVTRFLPEPSGYLHLGHAKAAFINFVLAKKFGGIFILRFDDTNPSKESLEYENAITEDLNKLGIIADKVSRTSDYFDELLHQTEFLLKNSQAYVDDSTQEEIATQRKHLLESKNRNNSLDHNITKWEEMKRGLRQDSCVRIKIDPRHKNAACRDPAIFRSISEYHYRTGYQYKVYPTYDFACPVVDSREGITHVFRSVEYANRDEQYETILDILKMPKPSLFKFGKVNMEGCVMGKRLFKELIEKGTVTGWDDPRLTTLRGLFNRGLHIEPFRKFIATLGFSQSSINMTAEKLWSLNTTFIDKLATRYTVVPQDKINRFTIVDGETQFPYHKDIPRFIKNKSLGLRPVKYHNKLIIDKDQSSLFDDGEEITLMNWGNMMVKDNILRLHLAGDFKKTKHKVPWIADDDLVDVFIYTYKGMDDPVITHYVGESDLINVNKGDYIQLLKMNYYMCTNIDRESKKIFLIELS